MNRYLAALPVFAACAVLTTPTRAATIDLSPLGVPLVELAATILVGIATLAVWTLRAWIASKIDLTKTQADEVLATNVDMILHKAIDYSKAKALEHVGPGGDLSKLVVDGWLVRTAAEYAIKSMKGYIGDGKIIESRVLDMVKARLEQHFPGAVPDVKSITDPRPPSQ